jgi:hypothetical protein
MPTAVRAGLAFVLCLVLAIPAAATILIFDQSEAGTATTDGAPVPQEYGDNVAGSSQGGYTYGEAGEGFTPNVTVNYGSGGGRFAITGASLWTMGYGDLTNVIYLSSTSPVLAVRLAADPGYLVKLLGFDLGGLGGDITVASISPYPGIGIGGVETVLGGSTHSDFDFDSQGGVLGQVIQIEIDLSNLDPGERHRVGMDNVRFGQTTCGELQSGGGSWIWIGIGGCAVPEPGILSLLFGGLASGVIGLRFRRRR